MTGITDGMRADQKAMREVSANTRVAPNLRAEHLKTFLADINGNQEAKVDMDKWGIKINPNMLPVVGCVLKAETIYYHGRSVEPSNMTYTIIIQLFNELI